jgi:hypothetical protein
VYVAWDDGLYYPARFVKYALGAKYVVHFDDGDVATVSSKDMKELVAVKKSLIGTHQCGSTTNDSKTVANET